MLLVLLSLTVLIVGCEEEEKEPEVVRQGPPPLEKPSYIDLGTFIVNMPGDKYYLKGSLQLAFGDVAPKMWMEARLPIVKDLVIAQLKTVTVEQFDDLKNRQLFKRDLQVRLNSLFPNESPWEEPEPVRKVLFSEFYRQ
ncbi:MAG: flagellar basal body-associated FliL family protein [SAR324 cluster bacterium]|jgi:flagellar FliL protein|nr:flagellar basal body-associated FliL family protein [SAR324 cluster bacterium]MDP7317131.1 flagellar basal body-associated FliL family protein [SAR324 cluster bacterium]